MSVNSIENHEIYVTIRDVKIEPKELYRLLSNSKQVTSGVSNRQWWKTMVHEFLMWSVFNKDSLDIFLIITSPQKLSELDVRIRLKRICGIRPTILFGQDELVFPMNVVEFKHYKNKGESIHSKDIIQYVNEKRKDPCVEV